MADKVIVTNGGVLQTKYGSSGKGKIRAALDNLVTKDKERGIETIVVDVDNQNVMAALSGTAVVNPADPKENKEAVDAIFAQYEPDYMMILGAIDVVPHQDLLNPLYSSGGGDPDKYAYSDLPYACDAPYGQNISDFVAPSRVVSRLPDINNAGDPSYLVDLIGTAASYAPQSAQYYRNNPFGLSAFVWRDSTTLSLSSIFGQGTTLSTSPPGGPAWPQSTLGAATHFINCHGAQADPNFYGQQGNQYPVALQASYVSGKLSPGTIAAAECCYGAELYDPAHAGGQPGMCNTYLGSDAYAFFGSSTIAYGPASGNGAADLICQYFIKYLLAGSSVGRAALQSRHEFAQQSGPLSPVDLKTLAQFDPFGDPSVHPVQTATPTHSLPGYLAKTALGKDAGDLAAGRPQRRLNLAAAGLALADSVRLPIESEVKELEEHVRAELSGLLEDLNIKESTATTYDVLPPRSFERLARKVVHASRFHVITGYEELQDFKEPMLGVIVVHEEDGQLKSMTHYLRR